MPDFFDKINKQAEQVSQSTVRTARTLLDFKRRMERILSQDHRKITIRDKNFKTEFTEFCQNLRQQTDLLLDNWQALREQARSTDKVPTSLQAKSFALRAKTVSRASDELTSAFDSFNFFYKKYTLEKLPVWILTSCCEDMNNLSGKILFLSRVFSKRAGLTKGV